MPTNHLPSTRLHRVSAHGSTPPQADESNPTSTAPPNRTNTAPAESGLLSNAARLAGRGAAGAQAALTGARRVAGSRLAALQQQYQQQRTLNLQQLGQRAAWNALATASQLAFGAGIAYAATGLVFTPMAYPLKAMGLDWGGMFVADARRLVVNPVAGMFAVTMGLHGSILAEAVGETRGPLGRALGFDPLGLAIQAEPVILRTLDQFGIALHRQEPVERPDWSEAEELAIAEAIELAYDKNSLQNELISPDTEPNRRLEVAKKLGDGHELFKDIYEYLAVGGELMEAGTGTKSSFRKNHAAPPFLEDDELPTTDPAELLDEAIKFVRSLPPATTPAPAARPVGAREFILEFTKKEWNRPTLPMVEPLEITVLTVAMMNLDPQEAAAAP
jgi:hypothetical protein